jgi:hypothetical protein
MRYCIDSSGLLDGWRRYYPPDILPDLPELLAGLVAEGRLLIPEDVVRELKKKDDDLAAWVKKHNKGVVPLNKEIQEAAAEILGRFMRLVDSRTLLSKLGFGSSFAPSMDRTANADLPL